MKKSLILFLILSLTASQLTAQDSKMNAFISGLMSKMTLEEKIGQLNLVTPGGAVTGSVVSKDVDEKIRKGSVGGLFGITGPEKVRKAQEIAVNNTRLHIPLIFGLDVIHGHKTLFPIPLGTFLFLGYGPDRKKCACCCDRSQCRWTGLGLFSHGGYCSRSALGKNFRRHRVKMLFSDHRLPGQW